MVKLWQSIDFWSFNICPNFLSGLENTFRYIETQLVIHKWVLTTPFLSDVQNTPDPDWDLSNWDRSRSPSEQLGYIGQSFRENRPFESKYFNQFIFWCQPVPSEEKFYLKQKSTNNKIIKMIQMNTLEIYLYISSHIHRKSLQIHSKFTNSRFVPWN